MSSVASEQFGRVWWIEPVSEPTSACFSQGRYAVLADSVEQAVRDFQKGFATDEVPTVTPGDWDAVAQLANCGYGIVDPFEWEPHPDHPGCVRVRRAKTIGEVCEELRGYLTSRDPDHGFEVWLDGLEEGLGVFSYDGHTPDEKSKIRAAELARDRASRALDEALRGEDDDEIETRRRVFNVAIANCAELYERASLVNKPWPQNARIVVFSVRGSNEGDYVHVEALEEGHSTLLMLAKTFQGRDAAWTAARRVADLLGV